MLNYNKIYSETKKQKYNQTFFCKNSIANWIAASWSYVDKNVLLLSIKDPLNMSRYFWRRLYFLLAEVIFCTKIELIERYSKLLCLPKKQLNFNPFALNVRFLYPLKTSETLTVFWSFQGVENRCIGWTSHNTKEKNIIFRGWFNLGKIFACYLRVNALLPW